MKGLKGEHKKKKRIKTTIGVASKNDLIKREFSAEKPKQKWCSDISYLPTKSGFVYLAVIMDLYSRKVVGACVLKHMEQSLILHTLKQAMSRYGVEKGMIFHSDRGAQYVSYAVQEVLKKHAIYSSRGKVCYDNAVMESFFSTLKRELMRERKEFEDLEQAQLEVFEYIETYYNPKRLHSTLGYKSPCEFEEEMKRLAKGSVYNFQEAQSTNLLERMNEEIKRRTRVVRIFPNGESCLRLIRALAVETHEGWP